MHEDHPHPLLAQIPLTLSPFLSLPTPVPLPYSYKSLPSTLPPSILSQPPQNAPPNDTASNQSNAQAAAAANLPAYVTSSTGTTAHPDAILSSCVALQQHLQKLESEARETLRGWEERRRQEDLAEKRRVAPGWLDSGVHILKPESSSSGGDEGRKDGGGEAKEGPEEGLMDLDPQAERKAKEGEELDRVFGGLQV